MSLICTSFLPITASLEREVPYGTTGDTFTVEELLLGGGGGGGPFLLMDCFLASFSGVTIGVMSSW